MVLRRKSQSMSLNGIFVVVFCSILCFRTSSAIEHDNYDKDSYETDLELLEKNNLQNYKNNKHLEKFFNTLISMDEMHMDDNLFRLEDDSFNLEKQQQQQADMPNEEQKFQVYRRQETSTTTTAPTTTRRRLTEKEKKIAQKVISDNLINKLKQIYVISTRSR